MAIPTQDSVIERYMASARQNGECAHAGKHKEANRAYDRMMEALRELRRLPDRGEAVLLALTGNENNWIRLAAAIHLLPLREADACATLEALMRTSGFESLEAREALKEWRAGRLRGN